MTPDDKGRFCKSCRKQVVDFSSMSDEQLIALFRKPASGGTCGRFKPDQLDRPLEPSRKRLTWLRYFFSLVLPVFFFSRASGQKLMGKPSFPDKDTSRIPIDHELRTLGMIMPSHISPVDADTSTRIRVEPVKVTQVLVAGRVVDEENKGIPFASVQITQNGKIIKADAEGRFSFIAASDRLLEFVCSADAYASTTYIYPFTLQYSAQVDVSIQLKKAPATGDTPSLQTYCEKDLDDYTDDGVTIQREQQVDSTIVQKEPNKDAPAVKFYPNPALPGQTLHIGLTSLAEGYYRWQLLDINGRMIQQKEFWIDEQASVLDIPLPYVSAGTYLAVLVHRETGQRFSGKIIIR
jgi:hypothetical protein